MGFNKKLVFYVAGALIAITVLGGGIYWKQTSTSNKPAIDIAVPNVSMPSVSTPNIAAPGIPAVNPSTTPVTVAPEAKPATPVAAATPTTAAPVAATAQALQNQAVAPAPVKKPKVKKVNKVVIDTRNESSATTEHEPNNPIKTVEPVKKEEPAAQESAPTEAEASNPPKEKKTRGLFRKLFKGVTENGGQSECTTAQRSMNLCN